VGAWFLAMLMMVGAAGADAPKALTSVPSVDLDRYAGRWYEISRYPNRFQKVCQGDVVVDYARRRDGRVDVTNRCRKADGTWTVANGVARVVDGGANAKLKVRFAPAFLSFLPMVWGDYWIIDLDPAYRYAVVGEPGRDYLWVLSREPALDPDIVEAIHDRLREQEYDPSRLVTTTHTGTEPPAAP
jgi:apolipoprotein D and lipocalin family protein